MPHIKLQHLLESLLPEIGENTAEPYEFTRKAEGPDFTTYEWTAEETVGSSPNPGGVKYTMQIPKTETEIPEEPWNNRPSIMYLVDFGIESEDSRTDYKSTSKTTQTGNMRRTLSTVIAALKREISTDNKNPNTQVSRVFMMPSKQTDSDNRRANLYAKYIEKNAPPGSKVLYDGEIIEIHLSPTK
jgi:hypothetical protein